MRRAMSTRVRRVRAEWNRSAFLVAVTASPPVGGARQVTQAGYRGQRRRLGTSDLRSEQRAESGTCCRQAVRCGALLCRHRGRRGHWGGRRGRGRARAVQPCAQVLPPQGRHSERCGQLTFGFLFPVPSESNPFPVRTVGCEWEGPILKVTSGNKCCPLVALREAGCHCMSQSERALVPRHPLLCLVGRWPERRCPQLGVRVTYFTSGPPFHTSLAVNSIFIKHEDKGLEVLRRLSSSHGCKWKNEMLTNSGAPPSRSPQTFLNTWSLPGRGAWWKGPGGRDDVPRLGSATAGF